MNVLKKNFHWILICDIIKLSNYAELKHGDAESQTFNIAEGLKLTNEISMAIPRN